MTALRPQAAASEASVRGSQPDASEAKRQASLLDLADRCEAATGPDAYLDLDIFCAVNDTPRNITTLTDAPNYCGSLDAAMLLAGELDFRVQRVPEGCRAIVWIEGRNVGYDAHAATPALALCAAALRARAAQ